MRRRAAEAIAVTAVALLVTLVLAAPVLRAPSERIFGAEIVGRHHDPFTTMRQFTGPITLSTYSQPVTDVAGAALARLAGGVTAYNLLVLSTFPLSACAAFLLARYLDLSQTGALLAALLFAFSPFHIAHAAYHPHIAQTQWLPLYFLALWRCLDSASVPGAVSLAIASALVMLSNFYGGMIVAVLTPLAIAAYWAVPRPFHPRSLRGLGLTLASLAIISAGGIGYAFYAARDVIVNRAGFAFPRADLFRYSAKWWSYIVPAVDHPFFGAAAHRLWTSAGVQEGLLEQQVSLGWGVIILGLVAACLWLAGPRQPGSAAHVPVLVVVASAALLCSLSPERTIGRFTFVRPSALLYDMAPMFRSYARFGGVVQLMAALLAGIGVDALRVVRSKTARIACVALVAVTAFEYAVAPSALWRDVLPTSGHRWIVRQPGPIRAFDCVPLTQESASIPWLTHNQVSVGGSMADCSEPGFPEKLSAMGYTHLLVRGDGTDTGRFTERTALEGLRSVARFDDGQVLAVTVPTPAIYIDAMTGFYAREHSPGGSWRWMGGAAAWTIVNTTARPVVAFAAIELAAFAHARHLEVQLDGHFVQTVPCDTSRTEQHIGPLTVSPGPHELAFTATEEPTIPDLAIGNGNRRRLSVAVGRWTWRVLGAQP